MPVIATKIHVFNYEIDVLDLVTNVHVLTLQTYTTTYMYENLLLIDMSD